MLGKGCSEESGSRAAVDIDLASRGAPLLEHGLKEVPTLEGRITGRTL